MRHNRVVAGTTRAVTKGVVIPAAVGLGGLSRGVAYAYRRAWGTLGITYYDHRFDHLAGPQRWHWMERGVFGARLIPENGRALDIGCGDGLLDAVVFSQRARTVDAIDRDARAVHAASRRFRRVANVNWLVADALSDPFPSERYDAIFLFAALEHFSVRDGATLLQKIGRALSPGGTFLGSTPIMAQLGGHNEEHENEFFSVDYLEEYLAPHFAKVKVWTSNWPDHRREAYFECSSPTQLTEPEFEKTVARMDTRVGDYVAG